jgi:hypothetical protein
MQRPLVTNPELLPLLLTMKHIQDITHLCRAKAYDLPNIQGFPAVRFGRTIRVPRDAFFRWLDAQAGAQE